jgi:hypothetical protein
MARRGSSIAAWLRRRFLLGKAVADGAVPGQPAAAPEPAAGAGPAGPAAAEPEPAPARLAALRGLGERPTPAGGDQAAEAELDTLRGELVRELDRMAEGDDGSGSFRRIAS